MSTSNSNSNPFVGHEAFDPLSLTPQRELAGKIRGVYGAINAKIRQRVGSDDIFGLSAPHNRTGMGPIPEHQRGGFAELFGVNDGDPEDSSGAHETEQLPAGARPSPTPDHDHEHGHNGGALWPEVGVEQFSTTPFEPTDLPPLDTVGAARSTVYFMEWLDAQQEAGVHTIIGPDDNEYIRRAWGDGYTHANRDLRRLGIDPEDTAAAGAALRRDRAVLEMLFERNYRALEGITDEVSRQVSQTVAEAFLEGTQPTTLARNITERIDSIGKTRATAMARYELSNAYNTSSLRRFERHGIDQVVVLTQSDACERCVALASQNPYRPSELLGAIPAHPHCRCNVSPYVNFSEEISGEPGVSGTIGIDVDDPDTPGITLPLSGGTGGTPAIEDYRDLDAVGRRISPEVAVRGLNPDVRENMGRDMLALSERGHLRHVNSITDTTPGRSGEDTVGWFDYESRQVYINGGYNNTSAIEELHGSNWLSTAAPSHTLRHEVGHAAHMENILDNADTESDAYFQLYQLQREKFDSYDKDLITGAVSEYAAASPTELVAEVFAGRLNGEQYSDEIMGLYGALGGPEVDPL